jgi:hypothetical protein
VAFLAKVSYANALRHEIDAECGPRRQRGIKEVNREVAGEAAIGEPAFFQWDLLTVAFCGDVGRVERHGAEQKREAQAHARTKDDGKIRGLAKRPKIARHLDFVGMSRRVSMFPQPIHYRCGEQ